MRMTPKILALCVPVLVVFLLAAGSEPVVDQVKMRSVNALMPAMAVHEPILAKKMAKHRVGNMAAAIRAPDDRVVPVGAIEVSRTEIAFALKNHS